MHIQTVYRMCICITVCKIFTPTGDIAINRDGIETEKIHTYRRERYQFFAC